MTTVDEEWAAQIARASNRKPLEEFVTLHDIDATKAAAEAAAALAAARRRAHARLAETAADGELEAAVEADPDVVAAREASEAAEEDAVAKQIVFHLRGLPPSEYDALQLAYPPTDAQELKGMSWNPETYIPALLAACSVKPLTEEQAAAIIEAGSAGESVTLFQACRRVNEQGRMSLGKGSQPTPS